MFRVAQWHMALMAITASLAATTGSCAAVWRAARGHTHTLPADNTAAGRENLGSGVSLGVSRKMDSDMLCNRNLKQCATYVFFVHNSATAATPSSTTLLANIWHHAFRPRCNTRLTNRADQSSSWRG